MSETTTIPSSWTPEESGLLRVRNATVHFSRNIDGDCIAGTQLQPRLLSTDAAENLEGTSFRINRIPGALRPMHVAGDEFELKEKFDGVVLDISDESFVARLFPTEANTHPAEAEFPRTELSPEDQALLELGAPFVLTIGYRKDGAVRRRESSFYMRRLSPLTDTQVREASDRATVFCDAVNWK